MQKICWSIKYLSGPLGHKIVFELFCFQTKVKNVLIVISVENQQFFALFQERRGHGGMLGRIIASAAPLPATERTLKNPPALKYGSHAKYFSASLHC